MLTIKHCLTISNWDIGMKPNKRTSQALAFPLLLVGSYLILNTAHASSDGGCEVNYSLDNRAYNGCYTNFPSLDTGNDTQTNLFLLLADKGLVSFNAPKVANISRYGYDSEYPFTLDELRTHAVSLNKNPNQRFIKDMDKNTEAEYCNSLSLGEDELNRALKLDANLTETERQQLQQFRQAIHTNCHLDDSESSIQSNTKTSATASITIPSNWTANAQPYADYIVATQMFYAGDNANFESSETLYRALAKLKNPNTNAGLAWLIDTSQYMLIRTAINRLYQSGMGEYSYETAKADPNLATRSQQAIDNYLQQHPKGRYIASARGLQRRLYWLIGQPQKLIDELEWQINHPNSPQFNLDSRLLPEEIERKVFFNDTEHPLAINTLNDPLLITSYALSRLRPKQEGYPTPLTLADMQALQPKFATRPELYLYLLATYYLVQQNNPTQALTYLPSDMPKGKLSYTDFSRYALKAKALQQAGKNTDAIALWQVLHALPKQAYQDRLTALALAIEADRTNDYSLLFGKNATIQDPTLQLQVIHYSADADLLKHIITTHPATDMMGAEARYALLTKTLLHRQYKEFLAYQQQYLPSNSQDYKGYDSKIEALKSLPEFNAFAWQGTKISPAITCQNLTTTVTKLAQNPQDRLQTLCLSKFLDDTQLDGYLSKNWSSDSTANANTEPYSQLGDVPHRFAGTPLNRLSMYEAVFADDLPDELSAYALHRAIGCFASSGSNHCSDTDVPIATRKGWYNQLKAKYPRTSWAKNQKYYW